MTRSILKLGLDIGNGSIKLCSKECNLLIPSVISTAINANKGRVKLDGNEYLLGNAALRSDRNSRKLTGDNAANKVRDIQRLYFGALANYPALASDLEVHLVLSSNAYKNYAGAIADKLSGEKQVELNGRQHNVLTRVVKVVPEGYGVIGSNQPVETMQGREMVDLDITYRSLFLLDLGNGTVIKSVYEPGSSEPLPFVPESYGVRKLFEAFQSASAAVNFGAMLDIAEVRTMIETSNFKSNGLNFAEVYKQCLKAWWEQGLAPMIDDAIDYQKRGYTVVCTGGGVLLPAMKPSLAKRGFYWVKDPVFGNASGLLEIAKKAGFEVAA